MNVRESTQKQTLWYAVLNHLLSNYPQKQLIKSSFPMIIHEHFHECSRVNTKTNNPFDMVYCFEYYLLSSTLELSPKTTNYTDRKEK